MSQECVHIIKSYFDKMHHIRQTGCATDELSYYCALETFINGMICYLGFDVACVSQPGLGKDNRPDFALCPRLKNHKTGYFGVNKCPFFGVIEVENPSKNMIVENKFELDEQVCNYIKDYNYVVLTNYREFLLLNEDRECLKCYQISEDEEQFWSLVENSSNSATKHFRKLEEFLNFSMTRMNIRKKNDQRNENERMVYNSRVIGKFDKS